MPVSERDIYLFDLRGFLKLEGALSPEEVAELGEPLRHQAEPVPCV